MNWLADTHTRFPLESPEGWIFYASHHDKPVTRLVVFVHGFGGSAVKTWSYFDEGAQTRQWWREADLLFVGYQSKKESITGVASRLRRKLPNFYPTPFPDAMSCGGHAVRDDIHSDYGELVLIGHSLGGLIVRRALCDVAMAWDQAGGAGEVRPVLLDAQTRLFSPASAGFQAAGLLGAARASNLWSALEIFLRRSPAYSDMQPSSTILTETQRRTEKLAGEVGFEALRAKIVWANPDAVVISERYSTDYVDDALDNKNHRSVCKPSHGDFEEPWDFAESGKIL